jgi:mannose-6-phosphate isomerase
VPELLKVLDFGGGPASIVRPLPVDEHEAVYETPAREFRLSRIAVSNEVTRDVKGPEILHATEGTVRANDLVIPRGCSAFVPASTKAYTLSVDGSDGATVYRATTNL